MTRILCHSPRRKRQRKTRPKTVAYMVTQPQMK